MIESQRRVTRRVKAAAAVAALAVLLALGGVAASSAQALVACGRDNGLTMTYVPSSGNWKSYHAHRITGCRDGTVTVNWEGWTDTPDDCFYGRVRSYRNGETTFHPWRGPYCYLGQYPLITGLPDGRQVRLEVKHMAGFLQTRDHVPHLTWTY